MTYAQSWPLDVLIPGSRDADEIDDAVRAIVAGFVERLADVVRDVTADPWVPKSSTGAATIWIPWWVGKVYSGTPSTSPLNSVHPSASSASISIAIPLPVPEGKVITDVSALVDKTISGALATIDIKKIDGTGGASAPLVASGVAAVSASPQKISVATISYTVLAGEFVWVDVRLDSDSSGAATAALYMIGVIYADA